MAAKEMLLPFGRDAYQEYLTEVSYRRSKTGLEKQP